MWIILTRRPSLTLNNRSNLRNNLLSNLINRSNLQNNLLSNPTNLRYSLLTNRLRLKSFPVVMKMAVRKERLSVALWGLLVGLS